MNNTVIVIGDSLYNTYGLIRSLGEGKVDFHFLCQSSVEWDPIERSRYIAKGRFIQFSSLDELPAILKKFESIKGAKYIICSSDPIATWVDNHETELNEHFVTPCRGGRIGSLFNKKEQCELAAECGLVVPRSTIYSIGQNLDFNGISYPVFIKPLISADGHKADIHICRNEHELKNALECSRFTKSFIIQTYIEDGYDLNCIGCRTSSQTVIACAIRKHRVFPEKYGAGSYMLVDKADKYGVNISAIEKIMQRSGYYGPFSVEFIHTKQENYFMEVNFRNDGLAYSATCAGVNLYKSFVSDTYIDTSVLRSITTMNIAFDWALWKKSHNVSFLKWIKQFTQADVYIDFSFKDPMPLLWRPIGFVLRKLKIKSRYR